MFHRIGISHVRAFGAVLAIVSCACSVLMSPLSVHAQSNAEKERLGRLFQSIQWKEGPCTASLGQVAQIDVPTGYRYCDADGTQKLLECNENPPDRSCVGAVVPQSGFDWTLYFSYDSSGYIKDDEKAEFDETTIAKLLEQFRAGTEEGNKERHKKGWPDLRIVGWEHPPKYDDSIKTVTWATRCESEGHEGVNYNVRLLGRGGVMRVTLVTDPEKLGSTLPTIKGILTGFRFTTGNTYAEWRPGEKTAEYGLFGLILGGVAWKTGLLAKLGLLLAKGWKIILVIGAGIAAWLGRLFSGKNEKTKASP